MTLASEILALLSALLILVGLAWGGWRLLDTERKVTVERVTIREIYLRAEAEGLSPEWTDDQVAKAGVRVGEFIDALTAHQDMELAAIAYLRPTLEAPFLLAVAGAVIGLAATVLALLG